MNNALYHALLEHPLEATVNYYATCFKDHHKATAYLQRQGLFSTDQALRIGFGDRTLGKHLPSNVCKAGRELRQRLTSLGIFKDNGREAFRGMVTVPLTSVSGAVTGIYGRRIDKPLGDAKPHEIIGGGIFNAAAITKQFEEIIVTDSILDAWAFYAAGHTHIVGCINCQLAIEDCKHIKRVVFAAERIDCEPFSTGCEIHRIKLPQSQSAHEYLLEHRGHQADPLGSLIRAAPWHSGACNPQPAMQPAVKPVLEPVVEITATHAPAQPQPVAEPAPTSSPVPAPASELEAIVTDADIVIVIESRRWRVRGLERNLMLGVMKVNLLVSNRRSDRFHVDCFDLYHARSRRSFTEEAADEIGCDELQLRSDLGRVLLKLEELQVELKLKSKSQSRKSLETMSDSDRAAALELLKDENLLERVLQDFERCGVVGERHGKLVGYLAATSRLLEKPLGLIIQSSSAAGKSSLAEAIMGFMPEEARFACSAMTGQSLYYLGKENLKHKILYVTEEEGARDASYQLKLLQSEGQLSLVATSKEPGSGRTATERYEVEGPVQLLLTTTACNLDPELLNRCLVVGVDESSTQTAAIHAAQRQSETLAGQTAKIRCKQLERLHQNAQRLLKPLVVVNPYADRLRFVGSQTRHRRDHIKYLTLIRSVALLHQYQREIKQDDVGGQSVEYIEVTAGDIAMAGQIADWALGRSIDELAVPTRRLLVELYDWIHQQATEQGMTDGRIQFSRRAAREALGWSATQLAYHLEQLCRFEYAVVQGRGSGKLYQYSLLYDGRGREGQPALLGLVDASTLN